MGSLPSGASIYSLALAGTAFFGSIALAVAGLMSFFGASFASGLNEVFFLSDFDSSAVSLTSSMVNGAFASDSLSFNDAGTCTFNLFASASLRLFDTPFAF